MFIHAGSKALQKQHQRSFWNALEILARIKEVLPVLGTPEKSAWDIKKAQKGSDFIVHEENREVKHCIDLESRTTNWSGWLKKA